MNIIGVIKGLVIIFGFVYIIISVIAYLNVKDADSKNRYIFPTWFLQRDIFNEYGKRLCVLGLLLFIIVFGGAAFLFFSE
jgi:hypothetical protein